MKTTVRTLPVLCFLTALLTLTSAPLVRADPHDDDETEEPFGAAVIIIELTDNDIELQVFADAFGWHRMQIRDPNGHLVFSTKAHGRR